MRHKVKKMPTREEILEKFIYLPEEGRLITKKTGREALTPSRSHIKVKYRKNGELIQLAAHRIIYFLETGEEPYYIDHIDGNPRNNHISNLRACSNSENSRNQKKRQNCSSKYKGVYLNKIVNKWVASITVNYKQIHIGYFNSEIEAAKAYDLFAIKYHKDFAKTNFPIENYK